MAGRFLGQDPTKIVAPAYVLHRQEHRRGRPCGSRRSTARLRNWRGRAGRRAWKPRHRQSGRDQLAGWSARTSSPKGIIGNLNLRRPIYRQTAAYSRLAAPSRSSPGKRPTRPLLSLSRPEFWPQPNSLATEGASYRTGPLGRARRPGPFLSLYRPSDKFFQRYQRR